MKSIVFLANPLFQFKKHSLVCQRRGHFRVNKRLWYFGKNAKKIGSIHTNAFLYYERSFFFWVCHNLQIHRSFFQHLRRSTLLNGL
jgi:hypothetical protein